jgi:hypothetical protein
MNIMMTANLGYSNETRAFGAASGIRAERAAR